MVTLMGLTDWWSLPLTVYVKSALFGVAGGANGVIVVNPVLCNPSWEHITRWEELLTIHDKTSPFAGEKKIGSARPPAGRALILYCEKSIFLQFTGRSVRPRLDGPV